MLYVTVPVIALAILAFGILKGGGGKAISDIWTHQSDKAILLERDEAESREAAAKELSENLLAQLELLRLVATTTAVSIQRFNDWPNDADHDQFQADALIYLCDWSARIFAFTHSDICKVTLWKPSEHGTLEVFFWNGMSPESARALEFQIHPADPNQETFAAMAFRFGTPQVCHDVGADPRYHKLGKAPAHAYASIIAVPIKRAGSTVGVFTVDSLRKDNFKDPDQIQKAEICASLCGQFWTVPSQTAAIHPTTEANDPPLQALQRSTQVTQVKERGIFKNADDEAKWPDP